jgi:hypothetical protein
VALAVTGGADRFRSITPIQKGRRPSFTPGGIAAAVEGSLMFGKGEIPVIVFGILFAMLFIFGAASSPPTGIYSEHRNYTDTLQRMEDSK